MMDQASVDDGRAQPGLAMQRIGRKCAAHDRVGHHTNHSEAIVSEMTVLPHGQDKPDQAPKPPVRFGEFRLLTPSVRRSRAPLRHIVQSVRLVGQARVKPSVLAFIRRFAWSRPARPHPAA